MTPLEDVINEIRAKGKEETPESFISGLIDVFDEIKRVLKPEGTVWVNLGDSYVSLGGSEGVSKKSTLNKTATPKAQRRAITKGIKPKNLIGIPWMFAFA